LAIRKPFSRTFSSFTMEFWLSRTFFFFTMEYWLSRSLFHELFFFFHDGISAIREPFSRTFSFFTMEFRLSRSLSHELFLFSRWNFGYQEAFLTNFFFFHDGISAITEPFSRTFSFFTVEFSRHAIWGKTLFIYIYIYQKEYLHRIRLVKNLAS
jgi:hypothetical protein